jgi:translation initiation factor IF-3
MPASQASVSDFRLLGRQDRAANPVTKEQTIQPRHRINHRIQARHVRVIGEDDEPLGVLETSEALQRAGDAGLDLVEIAPKADPPVCRIVDSGRLEYAEKRDARASRIKGAKLDVKVIKLRPRTDGHDLDVKIRAARAFLEDGHEVRLVVRFRGREVTHPEIARQQLDRIVRAVAEISTARGAPALADRLMTVVLAPSAALLQRVHEARAAAAAALRR